MKIYNGYERTARDYTLLTDEYEFTMAYGYLKAGKNRQEAVFDIFFRKIPNDGGYLVMAGVDKLIEFIKKFQFNDWNIAYFERNNYPKDFIDNIKKIQRFTGDIYAVPDGTPVFPNEPVVTIKGPLEEVQLLETAFLAILNGAVSHSTAARRIIESVPKNTQVLDLPQKNITSMEFGARRADGEEAAIDASLYAIMAGFSGTSNIIAADMLNIKAMGTMAHSWVESFPSEFEAFKCFAEIFPEKCILLVDTYDTLRSGLPNAIKTFQYMKEKGIDTNHIGIRIDSGDLAYLTKEARKMLNSAGFPQATICISNALDAFKIENLIAHGAQFDSIGVGENVSKPDGNISFVDKLVAIQENGIWTPTIKLSNDTIKIINPDYKNLYRAYDKNTGYAIADVMARRGETMPKDNLLIVSPTDPTKRRVINDYELVPLQIPIFLNGELVYEDKDVFKIQQSCNDEMARLCPEIRRTIKPQEYDVAGTENYVNLRTETIGKIRKRIRKAG